jgi:zinc transport system substrate-binding protein
MIILRTLLISIVLLVAACSGEEPQEDGKGAAASKSNDALVVTSNYPLYFFASRIAEGVDVAPEIVFPDIEGDPTFWIPSAEQVQLLQSADAVILNGAGAESWLNLITIDRRLLVDTSTNIADRLIALEDSVQHQHGPEGEHSHQGTAFTTWLDPQLAIAQAQSVTNTLIQLAPAGEAEFRNNMAVLEQELTKLDSQLAEVFAQLDGRPVLFSHPVYQYLQRHYEINGQSVHWEPEQEPSTSAWIVMQQIMAAHPATIMIWEDAPLTSTVQRLSDAGVISVNFHTAANRPEQGDYLSVMHENAKRLASTLQEQAPAPARDPG